MRKTKFLALALAVAVMMMGAGYAYWTDEITINSTVDTGNLEVTFIDDPDPFADEDTYMYNSKSDVNTDDASKLDVTLVDAYPGAVIPLEFTLKNTGTLAAYVNNFKITNGNMKDSIKCTKIQLKNKDGNFVQLFKDEKGRTLEYASSKMGKDKIFIDSEKGDGEGDKNKAEEKTLRITLKIDPKLDDTNFKQDRDSKEQDKAQYNFTIKADVKQYNEIKGKAINE